MEATAPTLTKPERSSRWRPALELVVVLLLIPVGLILGALTGLPVMAPILGMVVPLIAATAFLRREGRGWRALGFLKMMSAGDLLRYTLLTIVAAFVLAVAARAAMAALGFPPMNVEGMRQLIEGNTLSYLLFLGPVSWGSAAFGEELLMRGFVLDRAQQLLRSPVFAVVTQAFLFAIAHAYQGITGVTVILLIGLLMGFVYLRCGRNLWPLIIAHGVIDTIAITSLYAGWGLV